MHSVLTAKMRGRRKGRRPDAEQEVHTDVSGRSQRSLQRLNGYYVQKIGEIL